MHQELNLLEETLETATSTRTLTRTEEIRKIIEALLFSFGDPLSPHKIKEVVQTTYPIGLQEIRQILKQLKAEYRKDNRGFQIAEVADGYLLRTVREVAPYVRQLYQDRRGEKLSPAATETLAIVSHKQPITRTEIERIRGVDCTGVLSSLAERGLVAVVGRLEAPGRPAQYGVTKRFLRHFGLKDLQDLALITQASKEETEQKEPSA